VETDADRAARQDIAEQAAAEKAIGGTIFTRAFQFFLVPLLIVGACVGVYALFTVTLTDQRTPADWVRELKESGPVARKHAAAQLAAELRRQVREKKVDATLVGPILSVFESLKAKDGDTRQTRALLARCLGLLGDTRATPAILEVLREEDVPEMKAACIDALGALRDPEAAPDLIKLLDHSSSIVRKYATFTLGSLAAPMKAGEPPSLPAALEPLKTRLRDARPEVQWNAAFVLAFYLRDASGAPVLRRMLDRKHVTEVVTSSYKEPGGVGDETAANAPAIIAHVMQMGCQGVAALGDRSFEEVLRGLAKDDPDMGVRDAAMKTVRLLEKK